MRTPPPLPTSPPVLFRILDRVKDAADQTVLGNHNLLGNRSYNERSVRRMLVQSSKTEGIKFTAPQVRGIADFIAGEYIDEGGKAA